ncbi:MAG: DUF1092 family protein [Leptolyngbyaceae cyanobacterium RU_5_1]|nr:DUF1092 family protein [Leptolyngbyaceae cyanobacterium RU_5_1]
MTTIWELDFYSRPILDESNKKIWEVLVCESPLDVKTPPESLFRYAEYCASTEVNSTRLKQVLQEALNRAPKPPDKIRFFRQAMNNMITKACTDLGLPVVLSRRTVALSGWLQQRLEQVYPKHPGFQPGTNPSVSFAATAPQPLPDALMGQKWAFVTLEAGALEEMGEWTIAFGEAFPLSLAGLQPATRVPGLIIFSSRATPLAAWMSGLELASIQVEADPPRLLLETGVSDRWILATLGNSSLQAEATNFVATKQQAEGVHFLAVQSAPDAEAFAGFWLLQEVKLA